MKKVEFFFSTDRDNLPEVLETLFSTRDGSIMKGIHKEGLLLHVTAFGTWHAYRAISLLPGDMIHSLEHFEED